MKQPSDKDMDRLTAVAEEVLWYLERGTDPREIAKLLSKKHKARPDMMLQFITQLQMMATRVAHGGVKLQ